MMRNLAGVVAVLLAAGANAQAYPVKPIRIISGFVQGNSGDTALRMVSAKMSEAFGQPVVVETQPAATGTIAAAAVARSAPDGYTLLMTTSNLLTARYTFKQLTFDGIKDFSPITIFVDVPSLVIVNSQLPVKSVTELVDYARRNPGKIAYGSTGLGSAFHMLGEALKQTAGIDMLHVPYTTGGLSAMTTDLSTGRMQLTFLSYTSIRPLLGTGNVRVLAVIDKARVKTLPDVPIINEALPDYYNWTVWFGLLAPASTPRPIIDRLAAEARRGLADPGVVGKMEAFALTGVGNTPEEFAARIRRDDEYLAKVFPTLGIKPE
jgi:tripartite-type tricarboxylate transporter receptor subunit TctC